MRYLIILNHGLRLHLWRDGFILIYIISMPEVITGVGYYWWRSSELYSRQKQCKTAGVAQKKKKSHLCINHFSHGYWRNLKNFFPIQLDSLSWYVFISKHSAWIALKPRDVNFLEHIRVWSPPNKNFSQLATSWPLWRVWRTESCRNFMEKKSLLIHQKKLVVPKERSQHASG